MSAVLRGEEVAISPIHSLEAGTFASIVVEWLGYSLLNEITGRVIILPFFAEEHVVFVSWPTANRLVDSPTERLCLSQSRFLIGGADVAVCVPPGVEVLSESDC